ncbi:MAG: hypothetical protein ACI4LO_03510 [Anaerovoracaceae bacterium]
MKITDKQVKGIISYILKNKAELVEIADFFDYRDIENGILKIPEKLVNTVVKSKVMKLNQVSTYLKDYRISFENGRILADLRLDARQLGPVSAKYMIEILDMRFSSDSCRIYGTFDEDVRSMGNAMQGLALKAAVSGSTALQRLLKLTGCDFIFVDGRNIMIDLSNIEKVRKAAGFIELSYAGCSEGCLKLKFNYLGGR